MNSSSRPHLFRFLLPAGVRCRCCKVNRIQAITAVGNCKWTCDGYRQRHMEGAMKGSRHSRHNGGGAQQKGKKAELLLTDPPTLPHIQHPPKWSSSGCSKAFLGEGGGWAAALVAQGCHPHHTLSLLQLWVQKQFWSNFRQNT